MARSRVFVRLKGASILLAGLLGLLGLLALAGGADRSLSPGLRGEAGAMAEPGAAGGPNTAAGVTDRGPSPGDTQVEARAIAGQRVICVPSQAIDSPRDMARHYEAHPECRPMLLELWLRRIDALDDPRGTPESINQALRHVRALSNAAGPSLEPTVARSLAARRARLERVVEESRQAFLSAFMSDALWHGNLTLRLTDTGDGGVWNLEAQWLIPPTVWRRLATERELRDNLLVYFIDRVAKDTRTSGFDSKDAILVMRPADGDAGAQLRLELTTQCARTFRAAVAAKAPYSAAIEELNTCTTTTLPEGW